MEIKVIRKPNTIGTPGQFSIDGANKWRSLEPYSPVGGQIGVKGKCCAPLGRYKVIPRKEGEVYEWMSKKVPSVKEYGVPWIQNIDGESYPDYAIADDGISRVGIAPERDILIHIGDKLSDTLACCLVGMTADSENTIAGSTEAFTEIFEIVKEPMKNGNLFITYVNE